MQNNTDKILVQKIQSGDKKALSELVKRWHKEFCTKAYWLVKDKDVAKDIAQETWGVVIHKIDTLKDVNSFGAWAMRIIYNKSLDWLKAKAKTRNQLYMSYNATYQVEDKDDDRALKKRLSHEIKGLPVKQQMVIKLFYMESYSLKQISDQLNISVGTAKSRLFHAREKLRLVLIHKQKKL